MTIIQGSQKGKSKLEISVVSTGVKILNESIRQKESSSVLIE